MKKFCLFALVAVVLSTIPAHAEPGATIAEREKIIGALQFKHGGTFHLENSHGTITVDPSLLVLTGSDAKTFLENNNGTSIHYDVDAVLIDANTHAFAVYVPVNEGYVKMDDWADIDPEKILKDMTDGTEEANKERVSHGSPALHIIGWEQRPTLDRQSNTVKWSIQMSDGKTFLNSIWLMFNRYGFVKVIAAGESADLTAMMNQAYASFKFDQPSTYGQFKEGDKVAAYSIAGLVAALVGIKVAAKLGLLAFGAVLLKKIGVLFVVIPVFFRRIKAKFSRMFKGKTQDYTMQTPKAPVTPEVKPENNIIENRVEEKKD